MKSLFTACIAAERTKSSSTERRNEDVARSCSIEIQLFGNLVIFCVAHSDKSSCVDMDIVYVIRLWFSTPSGFQPAKKTLGKKSRRFLTSLQRVLTLFTFLHASCTEVKAADDAAVEAIHIASTAAHLSDAFAAAQRQQANQKRCPGVHSAFTSYRNEM